MKTSQQLVASALETIEEISVHDLLQLTQQKNIHLLDIREANEVSEGVVPGSIWISRGILEFQIRSLIEQLNWGHKQEIYLCCRSGNRSALAGLSLLEMGFERPISVAGGFTAWQESGFPISKEVLHY
jgi:rhodanese-related sulfurtransferase